MKFLALALVALPAILAQTPEETTGKLGDAPEVTNNPSNVTYEAVFNQANGIKGTFTFTAGKNGEGVAVSVDLTGFETKTGPFKYHIHDAPVPADGNCTGTLAHLDPYQRGQAIPCNVDEPETCEVGDLSGKHTEGGSFTTDSYVNEYTDAYLSLTPGDRAFFGNRSITIHGVNATRIACANVTLVSAATSKNGTDDDNSGKGGANGGSDNEDDDPADSAAGVARAGAIGLTAAVAAVVGLLL